MDKARWTSPVPIRRASFPKRPGELLPNHAVILDEVVVREYEFRRDSIVLALNTGIGAYQPFISWHRIVTSDSPLATGGFHVVDTTCYGDYSRTIDKALEKFKARVEEQLEKLEQDEANEEGKERLRLESNA